MYSRYAVIVEKFAEGHYIKSFLKKYKEKKWSVTRVAIEAIAANPIRAIEIQKFETIVDGGSILICKYDFAVAGTNKSPKGSGNRVIFSVDKERQVTRVLLVYHKSHLTGSGSETAKWKKLVKENYSEFKDIL